MSVTAAAIQLANGRAIGAADHSADMPKKAGKLYRVPQPTERQWLEANRDDMRRACGVSLRAFLDSQPLTVAFGHTDAEQPAAELSAKPRECSTTSPGYSVQDRVTLEVCGVMVDAMVSINVTLVNSRVVSK